MDANKGIAEAKVQPIAAPGRSTFISDELNRITEVVTAICPRDAEVSFTFEDGRLELNIDIRQLEELARIEAQLPGMCGGIFGDIQRGLVDNRPFFHRLTARVDR